MTYREKLSNKCAALLKLVDGVQGYYLSCADPDRKGFIETTIGAAIWYLPRNNALLFTGKISKDALLKNEKSEDHLFLRKIAAQEILNFDWNAESNPVKKLSDLYLKKYGKFNYVSKKENKKLVKFQKSNVFTDSNAAYSHAMIEMVDFYTGLQS